ncbi:hypothetical protein BD309DRAFT_584804 [Dichomitus squalens]|nr:hypothetical protein BD309DRAFT_584804 [Dichomitus squalens]
MQSMESDLPVQIVYVCAPARYVRCLHFAAQHVDSHPTSRRAIYGFCNNHLPSLSAKLSWTAAALLSDTGSKWISPAAFIRPKSNMAHLDSRAHPKSSGPYGEFKHELHTNNRSRRTMRTVWANRGVPGDLSQGDEAVRTTTLYARAAAAADLRMIWRTQTALDSEVVNADKLVDYTCTIFTLHLRTKSKAPNPSALPRDRLVHVSRAREPALRFSL